MKIREVRVSAETITLEYTDNDGYKKVDYFSRATLGKGSTEEHVARAAAKLKADIERGEDAKSRSEKLRDIARRAVE